MAEPTTTGVEKRIRWTRTIVIEGPESDVARIRRQSLVPASRDYKRVSPTLAMVECTASAWDEALTITREDPKAPLQVEASEEKDPR